MAQGPAVQDDATLALRASEGDAAAFGEIVRRYQGQLVRLCRRYVGTSDAEDVAQEAFVRAFLHVRDFDRERPLAPWLLTIARRLCLDRLRQRKVRPSAPDGMAEELADPPTAEQEAAAHQSLRRLAAALAKLPEGQREAVVLFHVEELPYREIAEVLDVPLGTVMTWLHRGRAQLRELMGHPEAVQASSGVDG